MDYLTNYYKNLCEQLQNQIDVLETNFYKIKAEQLQEQVNLLENQIQYGQLDEAGWPILDKLVGAAAKAFTKEARPISSKIWNEYLQQLLRIHPSQFPSLSGEMKEALKQLLGENWEQFVKKGDDGIWYMKTRDGHVYRFTEGSQGYNKWKQIQFGPTPFGTLEKSLFRGMDKVDFLRGLGGIGLMGKYFDRSQGGERVNYNPNGFDNPLLPGQREA
jgi:hypothetical protein